MKYQVIFFDADGVILQGGFKFTDKLTEHFGLQMEKMLPFFKGPFLACAEGKADVKEELAKVVDDWGWKGTVEELMDFWLSEGTIFDENNLHLVRELSKKGVHCFMATGQEKYRGEFLKQKVGQGNPFEDVFFSAEVGCQKKDPLFFQTLFDRVSHLTTDKSSILFVDDSEHIIEMAKQAGCDAIFYQNPDALNRLRNDV